MISKIITSHTRNITVNFTKSIICYHIPLYSEINSIGNLISIKHNHDEILIIYEKIQNYSSPKPVNFFTDLDEILK